MTTLDLTHHLTAALAPMLGEEGRLIVGFSGGLDSSVLLHALAQNDGLKARLIALHVHHGLSPNADVWEAHCQAVSENLGVAFISARVTVTGDGNGIEQAARNARYDVFQQHANSHDLVLVAHHNDDQVETFFQRLFRGSGLTGLASMAAVRPLLDDSDVLLVRPLLDVSRKQLEAYAQAQQLTWVEDESNTDTRYERNWWRNELLPQIWQRFTGREESLKRTLEQLQSDQALLQELLKPEIDACIAYCDWPGTNELICSIAALNDKPKHHRPYLLRGWLASCGVPMPSAAMLERIQREVIEAAEDRNPQVVLGDICVRRYQQHLYVTRQLDDVTPCIIDLGSNTRFPWAGSTITVTNTSEEGLASGRYDLIPAYSCVGQTLRPAGRPQKTLKHIWQENSIPPWLRDRWPLLLQDGKLCAVVGICNDQTVVVAHGYAVKWVS
ncbi:tRNA lysidine(34) synthetase TilS [Thalassolituus sp.]|jgi:tRNA(Ile)-lysidine synthase|uniref:tRNA lysidine(34) synthetase TilS n=1 Tax=Thalassolituus sp. TaxID=2030822 RepID=UPI0032D93D7E